MGRLSGSLLVLVMFAATAAFGATPASGAQGPPPVPASEPLDPAAFRVAFFADTSFEDLDAAGQQYPYDYLDQSIGLPGRTMKLVYAEGAELALHGGDIGYDTQDFDIPARWDQMVTDILGADFPLFASSGNHDARDWDQALFGSGVGYSTVLNDRYLAVEANPAVGPHLDCTFPTSSADDIGQKGSCVYKDTLTVVTVGLGERAADGEIPTEAGTPDNSFEAYLQGALAASTTAWTVCNWHFNQSILQTGNKTNEAGWKPYEYCRNAGALIATGHEHSYSRTHLLGRFAEDMHVGDILATGPDLTIDEGATVAWVSGLGGRSIRNVSTHAQHPWWSAQVNATNQSSSHGAGVLFCDFKTALPTFVNANAQCYFKTVDGVVHDRFELVSNANGATGTFATPPTSTNVLPIVTIGDQSSVQGSYDVAQIVATDADGPDPLTFHAVGLPLGLTLNTTTGEIVGAPEESGSFNVTVWAWDGAGSTEVNFTWTVALPTCRGETATIVGTNGDDDLDGTQGLDVIVALDGKDTITARGGNDIICAGGGDDHISAGSGDDFVNGGNGDDYVNAGSGDDLVTGGEGDDEILGSIGKDDLRGGGGTDRLLGGDDNDILRGDDEDDTLHGQNGDDRLIGGDGNDVLTGGDDNDLLIGQNHDDHLNGQDGDDRLFGSGGIDRLIGGNGDDYVNGGSENDTAYGQSGIDRLFGGDDNDYLNGGTEDDLLYGQDGEDQLIGGTGADLLNGGADDDTAYGQGGDDRLVGGDGNDYLSGGNDDDLIYGQNHDDTLHGGSGTDLCNGSTGDDQATQCEQNIWIEQLF